MLSVIICLLINFHDQLVVQWSWWISKIVLHPAQNYPNQGYKWSTVCKLPIFVVVKVGLLAY